LAADGGGLLGRIRRPGKEREVEEEDEGALLARKVVGMEQQVKTMQAQQSDTVKELGGLKDTIRTYVQEQKNRMTSLEDLIKQRMDTLQAKVKEATLSGPTSILEPEAVGEAAAPATNAEGDNPGGLPSTAITTIMNSVNMITRTAHVINERTAVIEKLHSEFIAQQVVISQNISDLIGRIDTIEKRMGIKAVKPELMDKVSEENLKGVDPDLIAMLKDADSEATQEAAALKKDIGKKKLAEKLAGAGGE